MLSTKKNQQLHLAKTRNGDITESSSSTPSRSLMSSISPSGINLLCSSTVENFCKHRCEHTDMTAQPRGRGRNWQYLKSSLLKCHQCLDDRGTSSLARMVRACLRHLRGHLSLVPPCVPLLALLEVCEHLSKKHRELFNRDEQHIIALDQQIGQKHCEPEQMTN